MKWNDNSKCTYNVVKYSDNQIIKTDLNVTKLSIYEAYANASKVIPTFGDECLPSCKACPTQ